MCCLTDPTAAKRAEQSNTGTGSATSVSSGVTGKRGYIGGNFGLPHRDFSYDEAFGVESTTGVSKTGAVRQETRGGVGGQLPRVLSTWMPLTPVRTDNGCMCTHTSLWEFSCCFPAKY